MSLKLQMNLFDTTLISSFLKAFDFFMQITQTPTE